MTVNGNTTVTATYNLSTITSITVSPSTATIGTQQQFTATVNGTGNFSKAVTWSLSCASCGGLSPGTLSSIGLYTTPYPAPASVTITATSVQNHFGQRLRDRHVEPACDGDRPCAHGGRRYALAILPRIRTRSTRTSMG